MSSARQVTKPFPVSMGWRWVRQTHRQTHGDGQRGREEPSPLPLLSRGFSALMVRNALSLLSELANLGAACQGTAGSPGNLGPRPPPAPASAPGHPLLHRERLPPACRGGTRPSLLQEASLHTSAMAVPPARRMGRQWHPREKGTAGNSGPSCIFSYKTEEEQLLFSSPRTPVCSTWLLLVFPVLSLFGCQRKIDAARKLLSPILQEECLLWIYLPWRALFRHRQRGL